MAETPDSPATGSTPNAGLNTAGAASGGASSTGNRLGGSSGGLSSGGIGSGSSSAGGSGSSLGGDADMGLEAGAMLGGDTLAASLGAGSESSGSQGSSGAGSTGGGSASSSSTNRRAEARSRFSAALEEARAGLEALRTDAAERGASYRAMASGSTADWVDDVKAVSGSARKRAEEMAVQGKTRASDGLSALGKIFSDTANVVDERLGPKYGDYARGAARSMQETAARLEAKELVEITDDVRAFVRKSPGTAVGVAAVAGFFVARLFGAGSSKD